MKFDYSVLNERIADVKYEIDFYKDGIEMIITEFKLQDDLPFEELKKKMPNAPEEFLQHISNGELPPDEMLTRMDKELLDECLQDLCFWSGLFLGFYELQSQEPPAKEYIEAIMQVYNTEHCYITLGFAALSLITSRAPTDLFLGRTFPVTDDMEKRQEAIDLFTELVGERVRVYQTKKNKLT